jgi:ERCC4-related helicase
MESFVEELKTQLEEDPQRKIVVFSQYADTVDALEKELKDH